MRGSESVASTVQRRRKLVHSGSEYVGLVTHCADSRIRIRSRLGTQCRDVNLGLESFDSNSCVCVRGRACPCVSSFVLMC
jgi:hypothetical protein